MGEGRGHPALGLGPGGLPEVTGEDGVPYPLGTLSTLSKEGVPHGPGGRLGGRRGAGEEPAWQWPQSQVSSGPQPGLMLPAGPVGAPEWADGRSGGGDRPAQAKAWGARGTHKGAAGEGV